MYRGEKAFCSWNCRSEEILIEEEMEKNNEASSSSQTETMHKQDGCKELIETSMFIAVTCVRKHGPNLKTTHIFGDYILERHGNEFIAKSLKCEEHEIKPSEVENSYLPSNFLSFCYSCKKKVEGEDIYMYRGEKAFCSWSCRSEEILIEEDMEKNDEASSSSQTETMHKQDGCEELIETSMFIAA